MGNLAGSGGYFVAMSADKIVAQPGTITASIGVLGGKLDGRAVERDGIDRLTLRVDGGPEVAEDADAGVGGLFRFVEGAAVAANRLLAPLGHDVGPAEAVPRLGVGRTERQ